MKTKKQKAQKMFIIKQELKSEDYKHILDATQLKIKVKQLKQINLMEIVLNKS